MSPKGQAKINQEQRRRWVLKRCSNGAQALLKRRSNGAQTALKDDEDPSMGSHELSLALRMGEVIVRKIAGKLMGKPTDKLTIKPTGKPTGKPTSKLTGKLTQNGLLTLPRRNAEWALERAAKPGGTTTKPVSLSENIEAVFFST